MARDNERKVTQSDTYEEWVNGMRIGHRVHRSYTIGSESDYIKLYHTGLLYMRDMPPDCMRLLIYLLPYVRYAEPCNSYMFDYSLTVTIDSRLKKEIGCLMCYKKQNSISNLLTELIYGGVLKRVSKGVYQLNPYLIGRGNVKDIGETRLFYAPPEPDDTFLSVYKANKEKKKKEKNSQEINQAENDTDTIE